MSESERRPKGLRGAHCPGCGGWIASYATQDNGYACPGVASPAAPRSEGLDVERLRWMIEQLPVVPGDYTEVVGQDGRGPFISKPAVLARLSNTGDTP